MTRVIVVGALALVMLPASNAFSQPAHTDRERAELKGAVQSVALRWEANHKDSYGNVEDRRLGSTTYDRAGNLLVAVEITPDFTRERKPERHGLNATIFRATMGNATEHYKFDARGNLTERQLWYSDKAEGEPSMVERMSYDSSGREIQRMLFDGRGKRFGVTLYTRDSTGNVVVEEDRPDGQTAPYPRMHYRYEYDTHGNWTAKYVTRENVAEDSYEYRYAGNLFRTLVYFDDRLPTRSH